MIDEDQKCIIFLILISIMMELLFSQNLQYIGSLNNFMICPQISIVKINDFVTLESGLDYASSNADPQTQSVINIPSSSGVNIAGLEGYNAASTPFPSDFKTQVTRTISF